ncbi:MAG: hypothetical protein ACOCZ9_00335 [Spirochaetota bacterium]
MNSFWSVPGGKVLALTLALSATLLAGCGLQRTVFLYPPEQSSIESDLTDGIVSFEHNTDNLPEEFRGYEIYYKLYGEDQNEKIDEEESSILDPDTQALPRLEASDFVRLRRKDEPLTRPLVDIPFDERTDSVVITIDFSGVSDGSSAVFERETEDGETVSRDLVRTIESGVYEEFTGDSEDYNTDEHEDIDDDAGENPDILQLVAYVLAYGEDPQELTPVYSFEARQLYEPPFDGLLD